MDKKTYTLLGKRKIIKMENNYKHLKPQIHICPICGKKSELYSVYEIIQSCPCIDCQLKQLGKRK